MLINRQDLIAAEYGEFYPDCINEDSGEGENLLLFAMNNSNEQFLKAGLRNTVIDHNLLNPRGSNDKIIKEILNILRQGNKTEMLLNVLIFADFGSWRQEHLEELLDWVEEITSAAGFKNIMFKCYNPVLVVCLCCNYLSEISDAKSVLQ